MTFQHHTALLARELGRLAVSGASVELDSSGLAIALVGRSDTLRLLNRVLTDSTGLGRRGTALTYGSRGGRLRSVEELEVHPVAVLSQTLATHPAPRPHMALSDAFAAHGVDQQGASSVAAAGPVGGWLRVARHVLLAGQDWSDRRPTVDEQQEWSAVADVAALAQVITVLDRHLAVAAHAHDVDPGIVTALDAAATSGLRSAATGAGALAASGPLPRWGEPGPDDSSAGLMVVSSSGAVAAAAARIATQVRAADHLSPAALTLVATGQVRLLSMAAAVLASTDRDRAARAGELAGDLTGALVEGRRLATIVPGQVRPVIQTREVLQHLARAGSAGWASTPPPGSSASASASASSTSTDYRSALAEVVDRFPVVVRALSEHADRAVRSGRWLVVNVDAHRAGDLAWRTATRRDPEPQLCTVLSAVAAKASALPAFTRSAAVTASPPRQVLAGVVNLDVQTRPDRPRHRPGTARPIERD